MARTPHGHHDVDAIRRDLAVAGLHDVATEAVDAVSRAPSARVATIAFCQGAPLRNDRNRQTMVSIPRVVSRAALQTALALFEAPEQKVVESDDVFAYQRLNPQNVYHLIWDDLATVFLLMRRVLGARWAAGAPAEKVKLVFFDRFGGGYDMGTWGALTTTTAVSFGDFNGGPTVKDRAVMLARFSMGTNGFCVHRRHCLHNPPPGVLRDFKRLVMRFYELPADLTPATERDALVIVRGVSRQLLEPEKVVATVAQAGLKATVIGPLANVGLVATQLKALASKRLYVLVSGAEGGLVFLAAPENSCVSFIL